MALFPTFPYPLSFFLMLTIDSSVRSKRPKRGFRASPQMFFFQTEHGIDRCFLKKFFHLTQII